MYTSSLLYNRLLTITHDSSYILQSFRQLVSDLNTPLVWLFWVILILVTLDVIHQMTSDSTKYGFLIGKVMIEAFFYSLFFAIWSDFFQKRSLRNNMNLVNKVRRVISIKKYIFQPRFFIGIYFFINNTLICMYTSFYIFVPYMIVSCILFRHILSLIVPYTMSDSQMYVNSTHKNQSVDAIIKWEYSKAPSQKNQANWVILT